MGLVENEKLVETFVADRSNPTLGVSIGIRCIKWGENHMNAFSVENDVERSGKLTVMIVDQQTNARVSFCQCPGHLPRLLGYPSSRRMSRTAGEVDTPTTQFNKYQHI